MDLLAAQGTTPITAHQGQAVAKEIGAQYMEVSPQRIFFRGGGGSKSISHEHHTHCFFPYKIQCSAKHNDGVKELFNAALKLAMRGRKMEKMKRRVCKIL